MSYRILVSPVSVDRKDALTLSPGENWLRLTRDPVDGVVRPAMLVVGAGATAEPTTTTTMPTSTCFLCLQYHRGLLLVKDMRPVLDVNVGDGGGTTQRPWRAWYSEAKDADHDDNGDSNDKKDDDEADHESPRVAPSSRAVPLHPRQAIWLQHRGRLMMSQGRSSPADFGLVPEGAESCTDNNGGSQETTQGFHSSSFSPPHLVWLEFWCGDRAGREVADRAVQAATSRRGAADKVPRAEEAVAQVPAEASPSRTKSESIKAAATDVSKIPDHQIGATANEPSHSVAAPQELQAEGSVGVAPTPPRSASARNGGLPITRASDPPPPPPNQNPALGAFVYTAESQTPPPRPRQKEGGGRLGGSPGRMYMVEPQDTKKGEPEPKKNTLKRDGAALFPNSDANVDQQDKELSHSQLQPSLVDDSGGDGGKEGTVEEDVVMHDVEADPSQGPDPSSQPPDDAPSAPPPPPVLQPLQTSVLCSPVDELLTQPPERDDPKGPTTTAAAAAASGSQVQESQIAAAAASALTPIKETETGEAGNSEDEGEDHDDDDSTVDPDEAQESIRSASGGSKTRVAPPHEEAVAPPPESTANAVGANCWSTPPRQNDANGSSRRRSGELLSPTGSDPESPSLLSPPSANSKSARRPAQSAPATPLPANATVDPSAMDPSQSPRDAIRSASQPAPSVEEHVCVSTSNPSATFGNGRDDASQSIPSIDSTEIDPGSGPALAVDDENTKLGANVSEPGANPPENGTVALGASPSTPIIKGGHAKTQVTTANAGTGSPISPTPAVSAKQAKADEVKHPALRTNASPAATSVDEEATVRRSSRKRATSETLSQRAHPTRKKTRGVEGRRLDVDLEAQEDENEEPRTTGEDEGAACYVLTTSFDDSMSQKIANMVKQLGGEVLDDLKDAYKCTHIVASDGKTSIKRTPKLMIALCVTTNIVTLKWLQDSVASGTLRDTKPYLILRDKEAEKTYSFSMSKTLQRVKERLAEGKTLLQGRKVFVCQTVFKNTEDGKRSPPPNELRLIVGAAGGEWVDKSKDLNTASARELLVITNSDAKLKKSQEKQKEVASALASGAESVSLCTLKSFLHAMMTQDIGSLA